MTNDITEQDKQKRFRILVCIDRTDESYRGLRYAVRIGSGTDADISLLYVRAVDQGLRTGGLQMKLARENLLEWGLELPGKKSLKRARNMLIEMGYMSDDWREKTIHTDVKGDPLGDNTIEYKKEDGRTIALKLMVSPSVDLGILDEVETGAYDIVILSSQDDADDEDDNGVLSTQAAHNIAREIKTTAIFAREFEEAHGHLICVDGTDHSMEAVRKDARIASRCFCPIYLFSVAPDDTHVEEAEAAIAKAQSVIEEMGLAVSGTKVALGDPVEQIVEEGRNYSLIVLAASQKAGLRRFFHTSVAYKVLEHAKNSVMLVR